MALQCVSCKYISEPAEKYRSFICMCCINKQVDNELLKMNAILNGYNHLITCNGYCGTKLCDSIQKMSKRIDEHKCTYKKCNACRYFNAIWLIHVVKCKTPCCFPNCQNNVYKYLDL